ncbi:pescadillo-related protein [Artemisia annua]|uniref:Pescadillo-related protein n=1 Tax=Artemisia annua TaxID=35608 RepID=A0A2U1M9C1_ARTAN|nr:pescadillo-related protein [Artemisia annua]
MGVLKLDNIRRTPTNSFPHGWYPLQKIVDRPTQSHKFISKEYIQPQWVFNCINARIILPTEYYMVGKVLPPHLSPFVDDEAVGYAPGYADTIKGLQIAIDEKGNETDAQRTHLILIRPHQTYIWPVQIVTDTTEIKKKGEEDDAHDMSPK